MVDFVIKARPPHITRIHVPIQIPSIPSESKIALSSQRHRVGSAVYSSEAYIDVSKPANTE